jgi:hypothetical protein
MNTVLSYSNPDPAGFDAGRVRRARQLASACAADEVTPPLIVLAAQRGLGGHAPAGQGDWRGHG